MFARNPQRYEGADQFEQDKGHATGPHQGDRNAVELDRQLARITLDQAGGSAGRGRRKHPGQHARRETIGPPMVFPQPIMILRTAFPASLPAAMQVLQSDVQQFYSASLSVSPVRIRNA
jgi:hypothetical protein